MNGNPAWFSAIARPGERQFKFSVAHESIDDIDCALDYCRVTIRTAKATLGNRVCGAGRFGMGRVGVESQSKCQQEEQTERDAWRSGF